MARKQKKNSTSNYLLLASIFLIIGIAWGVYKLIPRQSAEVFLISSLPSGEAVVTGTLQKDTPLGEVGNYYLVTEDGEVVTLDVDDLDNAVNSKVQVTGILGYSQTGIPYMLNPSISILE